MPPSVNLNLNFVKKMILTESVCSVFWCILEHDHADRTANYVHGVDQLRMQAQ